jgi:predicted ArsR family transcriptional regulator
MSKKKWTFLSNHGHIFAYVAEHQQSTVQYIAHKAGLSIRAVNVILDDLEEEGYLKRNRVGRNNHYEINFAKPLRHRLEKRHKVGNILYALGVEVQRD